MPTINDLRNRAALIGNATQVGENTASRVGTTFDMVADLLDGMGVGQGILTIDLAQLNTLNTATDQTDANPTIYNVTTLHNLSSTTIKVGTLLVFSDGGRSVVTQVLFSNYQVDGGGNISSPNPSQITMYYRMYNIVQGTWSTWTLYAGGGGGGTIDPYPVSGSTNAVESNGVFERLQDVAPTIDYLHLDDIDDYTDMLSDISPFYMVTRTQGANTFRIGTLMVFANFVHTALYQILATDFDLDENGQLITNQSTNGGLKLIWRGKIFSGNVPTGWTLNQWSQWFEIGGGGSVTIDPTPTSGSQNAVSSGGVYDALALKQNTLTFDDSPSYNSNNPVKSGGVFNALEGKVNTTGNETISGNKTFNGSIIVNDLAQIQEGNVEMTDVLDARYLLTFDETPTAGSNNPVKSKGIKTYVDNGDTTILTNLSTNYYTKTQVDNLIIPQGIDAVPVASLPASGNPNTLYFVQGANSFTISMWDGAAWVTLATISGAYDAGGALN